jgi:hypothetical protein
VAEPKKNELPRSLRFAVLLTMMVIVLWLLAQLLSWTSDEERLGRPLAPASSIPSANEETSP